jgi:WG containing repeat
MSFKLIIRASFFTLLLTSVVLSGFGDKDCKSGYLLPIIKGMKYGYIDRTGKVVVKPQFDYAWDFHEGLGRFEINDKFGFVDTKGRIVIKPQFNMALNFSDGLAAVKIPDGNCGLCGEWVYVNKLGEVTIHTSPIAGKSSYVGEFSEGLASFYVEDKTKDIMSVLPYGYINKTGKVAIAANFGDAREFHDGLAVVAKNFAGSQLYGYINNNGDYIVPPKLYSACDFSEGLAFVLKDGKLGFIDTSGKMVVEIDPSAGISSNDLWNFSDGYALIRTKNKYGYINKSGQIAITPEFEWAWHFSEGLAPASVKGKIGYMNKKGQFVIPPQFEKVEYDGFLNGIAKVYVSYKLNYPFKIGYIDTKGKYIWKPTI